MSAGQQATSGVLPGEGSATNFTVTVGESAGTYGFISATYGSVSPTTYSGKSLARVTGGDAGANDLRIELPLTVTQNFFRSVLVQRTDGTWTRYETSAATFSGGSISAGIWQWGSGSNRVWTSTGTRALIFYR